jgi:peptidoglycan/LPS O-acetylase OafA/YrhL
VTVLATDPARNTTHAAPAERLSVLDGWRAVSILLVLAGHLLPLGPSRWEMNEAVAAMGMVIFFTLSGFLITSFLSRGADLRVFIIRRFFRIAPLAWVVMIVLLIMNQSPAKAWVANLLFYANLPPYYLVPGGGACASRYNFISGSRCSS